jgi:arylsulfatase A-like enzyme
VFVSRRYGLERGFDVFDQSHVRGHDAVTSPGLTRTALKMISSDGSEPFFLWVHYLDPHFTYVRHPEFRFAGPAGTATPEQYRFLELRRAARALADRGEPLPVALERIVAVYDEEIAFTDAAIGALLGGIERLELERPTVTLLTADHGEAFMERGRFGHGRDVYQELVHVPLIIGGDIDEDVRGRIVGRNVEVASVALTLATLAGVEGSSFQGEDLLAVARAPLPGARSFGEGGYAWGKGERKAMVVSDGWKLIHRFDDDGYELYHLEEDPAERNNLFGDAAPAIEERRAALLEALEGFERRSIGTAAGIELSPEEREHLRALGYIE